MPTLHALSRIPPQDSNLRTQYFLQLVQVFFVGLTLGMTRTVIPAVAEGDFGVPKGDLALISTFVIAFGLVKGVMNFVAGAISETLGRKRVLVIGWLIALPIPWMIWHATSWWWIVAATVLLGVNQGLTWSMTLTSKLDLAPADRRGLTNGLNEFAGYGAVAIAGVVTAYLSEHFGARRGLLAFGCAAIVPALMMAMLLVRETRPPPVRPSERGVVGAREVFALCLRDRTFFALCQAGLIEKFVDALMWIVLPVYLIQRGVELRDVGWAPGVYAMTWGCSQLITGPWSDRIGRKPLVVGGMLLCAIGVALLPMTPSISWWSVCAGVAGLGMGMLYPTLGAAVSDLAPIEWRGTALGVYRFWRDLGYALGAVLLAALALLNLPANWSFLVVGACVAASALGVGMLAGETRGRTALRI
jgi:MFS family permease